jgi:hypothetical protein
VRKDVDVACVYKLINNSLDLGCRRWRRDVLGSISPLYVLIYTRIQISVEKFTIVMILRFSKMYFLVILPHYN